MAAKQAKRMRIKEEGKEEIGIPGKRNQIGLPDHMCENVLLNLCGKSLLRFKCVSKQWHSLISSPRFNRDYLHHNRNNPAIYSLIIRSRRVLHRVMTANQLETIRKNKGPIAAVRSEIMADIDSIVEEEEENQVSLKKLLFSFLPSNWDPFEITCSSDGIVCVTVLDRLLLWNPYTNEHKTLPLPDPDHIFATREWQVFGLGYDSSVLDYKLASVPSYSCSPLDAKNSSVYVMTLKSNLWRKIYADFPYAVSDWGQAVSADGGLYWFAQRFPLLPEKGENLVLISLDLAKETFRQVPLPPNTDKDDAISIATMGLGLLGGCISLATKCDNCFDIWLFKEDTWIKFVSFPLSLHHGPAQLLRLRPLFINKDGTLVMHASTFSDRINGDIALIYDPKQGICRKFEVSNMKRWVHVIICTKSLASLSS